jgi:hypothetical protein
LNARTPTHPELAPLKNPALAAFLAWLVPGLGHVYQGRRGKGVLYLVCILGLYVAGLWMGDWKVVFWRWTSPSADPEKFRFSYVGQFFVGLPALPALIQATLKHYGMGFILGGFLAEPPLIELNAMHPKLSRAAEIGWVYTVIAGLLNVLAIFDAYEGPAFGDEDEEEASEPSASAAPAKLDGLRTEGRA